MLLSEAGCPWKDHLLDVEQQLQSSPLVKYVLYADSATDSWRLQCVPVTNNSFENRFTPLNQSHFLLLMFHFTYLFVNLLSSSLK